MNEAILTVVEVAFFFGGMTYAAKRGEAQTENERIEAYLAGTFVGGLMLLAFFYLA